MTKRAASRDPMVVGEWFAVAPPCPRCGGATEARTSAPRQVGLPWASEPPPRVEWRCGRALAECTGPTLEETQSARSRLSPDRARALGRDAPAAARGGTFTCTTCGAVWGRALLRCPVDQGAMVPTASLRRSA
jgi:predicted RNA-binding Zn-ribbon protein involved in translation (DUF1610 family)